MNFIVTNVPPAVTGTATLRNFSKPVAARHHAYWLVVLASHRGKGLEYIQSVRLVASDLGSTHE